ncbi:MAG: hypothetical protein ACXWIP_27305, partial [Burkholderiales bacterium]
MFKPIKWVLGLVYIPGALLLALHVFVVLQLEPSEVLRFALDSLEMCYLAGYFVIAAGVLWHSYFRAETPILRQQMKWV